MRRLLLAGLLATALTPATGAPVPAPARLKAAAARVTITRDDWGIAHVHGKSDADAVFGMVYAQAEDDFPRIERNYLVALGRLAEAEGKDAIWQDLRQRLFVDPADLRTDYAASPAWLRAIMDAWADGLNYYLATHPRTKPRALARFEPWMALAFTEGSIGGDIERVDLGALKALYGGDKVALAADDYLVEPTGSNGIAVAPANTANGHALLLINPHTSFFFRSELQMSSDAGLDAYGAATWGQPFLYQGFNAFAGWMHTSSGVDAVDEFAETFVPGEKGALSCRYGKDLRPVTAKEIVVRFRDADGGLSEAGFTARYTHHGPIVRRLDDGRFVAMALMNRPVPALEQSFARTKAHDLAGFLKVAALQANSSNDTIFADGKGEIAYLHPQFVPQRDDRFDYRGLVDGSDPATDWHGLTPLDRLPQLVSPAAGWVANSNDAPWGAAGPGSLDRAAYPRYMDMAGANPRGEHYTTLFQGKRGWTLESFRAAAFDSWMPTFATMVPKLAAAWDRLPAGADKDRARDQVALLRAWDDRWAADSTATSLAVFWGTELWEQALPGARRDGVSPWDRMAALPAADLLAALDRATARLTRDFGRWQVAWGEINRFQRNDAAITQTFDDAKPSTPVPFTSALWGSLASFGAKPYPGTKRWYGTSGNSFVAAVEFGPRVRAVAVTAGGESGDPASPHFDDQAGRYAGGALRPVYFYADELRGHVVRSYHPGG